jgi:hypothetical protein
MRRWFVTLAAVAALAGLTLVLLRTPPRRPSPATAPANDTATTVGNEVTNSVLPTGKDTLAATGARELVVREDPDSQSEAALMAQLRATLGRGTPQATLDLARKLEKTYPDGAEAEERSLCTIDALIALNRIADMRDEARRHLAKWQGSPISARVEARTGVHPAPRPLR